MDEQRKWSLAGSAAGLLALGVLLLSWWLREDYSRWGRLAALGCAAVFALLGLRFMPRWVRFWSPGGDEASSPGGEPPHMPLKISLSLLGLDLLVLALAWLLRTAMGRGGSFAESLSFWTCTDSQHYLAIAEDWYLSEGSIDRLVQLVFLPGYPLLVRLFRPLAGGTLTAGLLVSALSFAGAGVMLYRLLRLDLPHETALRALVFACLLPGSFFYVAPMSESLFLLCSLGCVYLARRDRWLAAGLFGLWAAFTRSLGLMLMAPLLMLLIRARIRRELTPRQALPRAAAVLLVPLGFALYCYINYRVSGDPFRFMVYQAEHWGQHLGLFFNTAAYQTEQAIRAAMPKPQNLWGLWLPNLIYLFAAPALVAAAAGKLRCELTAWFIAYYLVAMGATWLLSAPRYLMAMPVLPAALSLLTGRGRPRTAAVIVLSVLWTLYFLAFLLRWQVW